MNALLLTTLALLSTDVDITSPGGEGRTAPAVVHGAAHHGDVAAHEIIWSSTLLVRVEDRGADFTRIAFARPLPEEVVVTALDPSARVELDGKGRAIAVVTRVATLGYGGTSPWGALRRLDVTTRQALPSDDDLTLFAPLLAGDAVQRVTLSAATPLRFTADSALGIERRIGKSAGVDVNRDERHRLDRWIQSDTTLASETLYLRAGTAVVARGLTGSLERSPAQRTGVGLAAALAFGLVVIAGTLLYRRAAREADIERVDAILEEDYRALG